MRRTVLPKPCDRRIVLRDPRPVDYLSINHLLELYALMAHAAGQQ